MTGTELIVEGERLARPCVLLAAEGGAKHFAAVWGGRGLVPAPPGPFRHWLTVDCRFLPQGTRPGEGCLSVYTNEEDCQTGEAVHEASAKLRRTRAGQALYAQAGRSLPPIDGVFRFGSRGVRRWLGANGWRPDWGYNDNFPDRGPAKEYERLYQKECPLYAGGVFAVLGGWHFPWPDGDWAERSDESLFVWTIEGSEPWVEVWKTASGYRVIQRIT
jgi:hypothetical protein